MKRKKFVDQAITCKSLCVCCSEDLVKTSLGLLRNTIHLLHNTIHLLHNTIHLFVFSCRGEDRGFARNRHGWMRKSTNADYNFVRPRTLRGCLVSQRDDIEVLKLMLVTLWLLCSMFLCISSTFVKDADLNTSDTNRKFKNESNYNK